MRRFRKKVAKVFRSILRLGRKRSAYLDHLDVGSAPLPPLHVEIGNPTPAETGTTEMVTLDGKRADETVAETVDTPTLTTPDADPVHAFDDPTLQQLLAKRQQMTDVSANDELERQRRMYNMLRHSHHYKKLQVRDANARWGSAMDTSTLRSSSPLTSSASPPHLNLYPKREGRSRSPSCPHGDTCPCHGSIHLILLPRKSPPLTPHHPPSTPPTAPTAPAPMTTPPPPPPTRSTLATLATPSSSPAFVNVAHPQLTETATIPATPPMLKLDSALSVPTPPTTPPTSGSVSPLKASAPEFVPGGEGEGTVRLMRIRRVGMERRRCCSRRERTSFNVFA
ncbi:hypothetical protein HK102_011668, partial [Quaeritorhiza haematococci]